ncbi:hypothetical protein [Peribacillus frigoritolerans]|uniref:hypothetical protein n=1 Tax=Peribacillus frigoritolerans TaxID=450367 RepID=UPI0029319867|nr:hypothetical protein [Peribacillus frigoritolerans]
MEDRLKFVQAEEPYIGESSTGLRRTVYIFVHLTVAETLGVLVMEALMQDMDGVPQMDLPLAQLHL